MLQSLVEIFPCQRVTDGNPGTASGNQQRIVALGDQDV